MRIRLPQLLTLEQWNDLSKEECMTMAKFIRSLEEDFDFDVHLHDWQVAWYTGGLHDKGLDDSDDTEALRFSQALRKKHLGKS